MTRTHMLLAAAALLTMGTRATAQEGTAMTLRPESKVTLNGSSNVHDWACASSGFEAKIELSADYAAKPLASVAKPIEKVAVTIPVKSLKCGKGKMDDNMYKALKADAFPTITYTLDTYEVTKDGTTAEAFTAKTIGELTVAGQTQKVEIPITAERLAGGSMKGVGTAKLLMTDFGIKPPVALLGTLRTKNEISITFTVLLDKSSVVALTR